MSRLLVKLPVFLILSAMLGAAILFYRPQDLSGVTTTRTPGLEPSELADTLSQVVIKQAGKQYLTEGDINAFFTNALAYRQDGVSSWIGTPEHIVCDLHEKTATLHFRWLIRGHPLDASVDFTIGREGPDHVFDIKGGHYGKLAVPRFLLGPLRPILQNLATVCQPEIQGLLTLPRLAISKERLVLDPTF